MIRKHNRLINEKSPYLLQHAYNPVDWFPWGPEAFDKAKREQKPVFLSIGYSTCHWCHVMERESFEDEEIAALLNDHFIAIKVDREERPDIDSIYMEVCSRQSGQGGWPLNAFLTPDQKPFYIGTYFPKESKYGRPGMMDVLPQLAEIYRNEPERIQEIGDDLTEALKPRTKTNAQELPVTSLHNAFTHLNQLFDSEYGGFNGAPKFPSPGQLLFLLRYYNWTGEEKALLMVEKTLQSIADGGLYDQIGGGFARYSTDEKWLVPHFEKMLYDQAHLLTIYTEAYQITRNPRYKAVVYQTAEFLKREMTHPASGFYSAIDADSEGEEGTYYIWTKDEIVALLGPDTADLFCEAYAISQDGNFEGKNIPNLIGTDFSELASKYALSLAEVDRILYGCRKQLLEEREKRVYPHWDDKILTSWNGLMIAALAKAGATFSEPDFSEMAERAARFIENNVWKEDFLYARFRDGEAKFLGYVDDYAYLLWGYIELHQATGSPRYLERAVSIGDSLFQRFEDKEQGGFFFTDQDAETLLIREKNALDGAMLSGNGVAALQLWRLAKLTADKTLLDKADQLITTFADEAADYPTAVLSLLMARIAFEVGGKEIVISGYSTAEKEEILHCLQSTFHPYDVWIEATKEPSKETASLAKGKFSEEKPLVIHVCENSVCGMPVYAKEAFLEGL